MEYLKELRVQYVETTTPNRVAGQVRSAEDVHTLFKELEDDAKEKVLALYLDARMHIVTYEVLFIGNEESCELTPRQVFKSALLTNTSRFILIHNHPTGDPTPTESDKRIMEEISQGADVLDMQMIDFVIIGRKGFWSSFKSYGEQAEATIE